MKIAEVCDKCDKPFDEHEPKALMKDKRVLCWECYEKEK
jgi:predicted CXXCH cytochrome family protein